MKTLNKICGSVILLTACVVLFQSCSSSDSGPSDLSIDTISVDGSDLNGATSPSDIATDASITITFNSEIKAETANSNNITLTQDYDSTPIDLDISVSGNSLTVSPVTELGTGILYLFELKAGLTNTDDQPIGQTSRTFTTTGTFAPSGMIANWTFEDTANDMVGNYSPTANDIVDVTYTASRNEEAGKAATFNGNTSLIEIPNADPLLTTNDFSISFWFKTDSDHLNAEGLNANHFVMGLGAFYGLFYEVSGGYESSKFGIRYEFDSSVEAESGSEDMWFPVGATDNTNGGWQGHPYARDITQEEMEGYLKDNWTMVTFTYDAQAQVGNMYLNDELMKTLDFNLWPDDSPQKTVTGLTYSGIEPEVVNELTFGFVHSREGTLWDETPWGDYGKATANHFKGQLDDVKIYHKAISETEIQLMFASEN